MNLVRKNQTAPMYAAMSMQFTNGRFLKPVSSEFSKGYSSVSESLLLVDGSSGS
jgi:hypothetical protein